MTLNTFFFVNFALKISKRTTVSDDRQNYYLVTHPCKSPEWTFEIYFIQGLSILVSIESPWFIVLKESLNEFILSVINHIK